MGDLIENTDAMRAWTAERDVLTERRRKYAAAAMADTRRRDALRAEHERAVAEAVENGDPLPDAPNLEPDPTLDRIGATLQVDEMTHRENRATVMASIRAEVETAAAAEWKTIAEQMRPHVDALDAARQALNSHLANLRTVRQAATPDLHGGPADRTRQGLSVGEVAGFVRAGVSPLPPEPAPYPVRDDHDENTVRRHRPVTPSLSGYGRY